MTIDMPEIAKVSMFTDNDLTHITDDHFEIKLIARLLPETHAVTHQKTSLLLVIHTECLYFFKTCFSKVVEFDQTFK